MASQDDPLDQVLAELQPQIEAARTAARLQRLHQRWVSTELVLRALRQKSSGGFYGLLPELVEWARSDDWTDEEIAAVIQMRRTELGYLHAIDDLNDDGGGDGRESATRTGPSEYQRGLYASLLNAIRSYHRSEGEVPKLHQLRDELYASDDTLRRAWQAFGRMHYRDVVAEALEDVEIA